MYTPLGNVALLNLGPSVEAMNGLLLATGVPVTKIAASGSSRVIVFPTSGNATYDITLTANCALTLTGAIAGQYQSVTLILRQDATAGRVATLPSGIYWLGGSLPTVNTTAGHIDVCVLATSDAGATVFGRLDDFASNATYVTLTANCALTLTGSAAGAGGQSPSGTALFGTTGTITDSASNVWSLRTSASSGLQIYIAAGGIGSPVLQPNSAQVVELVIYLGVIYQYNSAGAWYQGVTGSTVAGVTGSTSSVPNPLPSIASVSLSSNTVSSAGSAGVTIGTISVGFNNGTFAGSLTLSNVVGQTAAASLFTIVGSTLKTASALSNGTYYLNITATSAPVNGVAITAMTQALSVTVGSLTSYASAPSQAVAAGFTTLTFSDDFTSLSTIDQTGNATSGYNWYWSYGMICAPNYQVAPPTHVISDPTAGNACYTLSGAMTASQVSNGNTSGGTNASPVGGIIRFNGDYSGFNSTMQTCVYQSTAQSGPGIFRHGYYEAYIQLNPNGDYTYGWPAYWTNDQQQYNPANSSQQWTEIDFMETYNNKYGPGGTGKWTTTGHDWSNSGSTQYPISQPTVILDSEWHTYGMLWVSTGAGTGNIKYYFDNAQIVSYVSPTYPYPNVDISGGFPTGVGAAAGYVNVEVANLNVIFGTGLGWPMYVDWTRVWTA